MKPDFVYDCDTSEKNVTFLMKHSQDFAELWALGHQSNVTMVNMVLSDSSCCHQPFMHNF